MVGAPSFLFWAPHCRPFLLAHLSPSVVALPRPRLRGLFGRIRPPRPWIWQMGDAQPHRNSTPFFSVFAPYCLFPSPVQRWPLPDLLAVADVPPSVLSSTTAARRGVSTLVPNPPAHSAAGRRQWSSAWAPSWVAAPSAPRDAPAKAPRGCGAGGGGGPLTNRRSRSLSSP